jgi:hypothetical protein
VPVRVPVRVPVSARERVPLEAARESVPLAAAAGRPLVTLVLLLKRPEPWNCWRSCRLRNR